MSRELARILSARADISVKRGALDDALDLHRRALEIQISIRDAVGAARTYNNMGHIFRRRKDTRHAAISIYDAKEHKFYSKDTPCTYAIQFTIVDNRLNMAVLMRSNDLWYGFCNDQYCFSMIQKLVADRLDIKVGEYYHYAHNLHLYNDKI